MKNQEGKQAPEKWPAFVRQFSRKELAVGAVLTAVLCAFFFFNVFRYQMFADDAFISFRYADNLVRGEGLVWNPGERVEGYTNFLWVLLMAGSIWIGGEPEVAAMALNILSAIVLIVAIFLFSARHYGLKSVFNWLVPVVLVVNSTFTAWCSGGLATIFFTTLVFLAYMAYLRERERQSAWPIQSSLLFSLAALTRPEGSLFFGIAGLFFLIDLARRKRTVRAALAWGLPYVVIVGSHFLWRYSYYGFWLPNTFYAKVPGVDWAQGFRYYSAFLHTYHVQWFLPLALLSILWRPRFVNFLFGAIVVFYGTYIAAIGGDYLEFRFLLVIFPYVYWLIGDGLERLTRIEVRTSFRPVLRIAVAICTLALVVTTATGVYSAVTVEDIVYWGVGSTQFMKANAAIQRENGRFLRELIDEGLLPDDVVLGMATAGGIPYYSRLPTVDRVGLNDVYLAHAPPVKGILPGHWHFASEEYLRERGVVILEAVMRMVQDQPPPARDADPMYAIEPEWQRALPLRVVKAKGRYLVFVTLAPEEKFQSIFRNLEIIQ